MVPVVEQEVVEAVGVVEAVEAIEAVGVARVGYLSPSLDPGQTLAQGSLCAQPSPLLVSVDPKYLDEILVGQAGSDRQAVDPLSFLLPERIVSHGYHSVWTYHHLCLGNLVDAHLFLLLETWIEI